MRFYKIEAAGNDFVVADNRRKTIRPSKRFVSRLCDRRRGVGADGLILIERSRAADFKMRIFNADGSEAEMCGNGARCAGLLAHRVLGFASRFAMETLAGIIGVHVKGRRIKVALRDPADFRDRFPLAVEGRKLACYFINTGVPHAVTFVRNLGGFPVSSVGEKIRYHRTFKPRGTNVNFVRVRGRSAIDVRTYERGVGETLACGTGVTASAVISVVSGKCRTPVSVSTRGGSVLKVGFTLTQNKIQRVFLEGDARIVYQGEYK